MLADRVECAITVEAPVDRVWAVMTEARHLAKWYAFGGAEIDLRPLGMLVFRWPEHGVYHGQITTLAPPYALSFRFACLTPDEPARPGNSTRVAFTLEPAGQVTRVRVAESGFAQLDAPDQVKAELVVNSRQAWTDGLGMMRAIAVQSVPMRGDT